MFLCSLQIYIQTTSRYFLTIQSDYFRVYRKQFDTRTLHPKQSNRTQAMEMSSKRSRQSSPDLTTTEAIQTGSHREVLGMKLRTKYSPNSWLKRKISLTPNHHTLNSCSIFAQMVTAIPSGLTGIRILESRGNHT